MRVPALRHGNRSESARMLSLQPSLVSPRGVAGTRRVPLARPREAGLTLVELLIAVALLGFILLGIAPLFMASVKSNYAGNEYTSIHMLARDRLEQLMNRTFNDALLDVTVIHNNDLAAFLPDPTDPTKFSTVPNPFTITYQVTQWRVPDPATGGIAVGAPFTANRIIVAGQVFQYKRVDVTVASRSNGTLAVPSVVAFGLGARLARVAGFLANPAPQTTLSVADANP
jgi:type II secretory pathway pseudopilin PulG